MTDLERDLLEALKAAKPLAVRGLHWWQQRIAENPREDDAGKEDGLIAVMEQIDAVIAKAEQPAHPQPVHVEV